MLAFLLALSTFAYFWMVGLALGVACCGRRWLLGTVLLAPVIGFSAVLTIAVFLNYVGLPVESFAIPLAAVIALAAIALLWIYRPPVPWRRYAPYLAIFGAVFALNGVPFFRFGFDWISISNDDASTYAVSAYRLLHQGFWDVPPLSEFMYDANPFARWYYHFTQFPGGIYHTFDVTLAMLSRITGLNTYQVYMPAMAVGLLCTASASGALLLYRGFTRGAPIVACFAVGLSSLMTLGYMHQLGPQEFGLAMFVGCTALLTLPRAFALKGRSLAGYAAMGGLVLTGFNLTYGAYQFMLVPALVGFVAVNIIRHRIQWKQTARFYAVVVVFAIAITNVGLQSIKSAIVAALTATNGKLAGLDSSFPFYVVPSGLANFWGLYPIASEPSEPYLSAGIAIGALLIIAAVAASAWLAWRGLGVAMVALAIFGLLGIAAVERGDFALFKLTMYIQPFLWATLTAACFTLAASLARRHTFTRWRTGAVAAAPIVMLTLYALNAQQFYIERSEDIPGSGLSTFVTLQHGSSSHILAQLAEIRKEVRSSAVVLATDSHALGFYESYYMYGLPNFGPSTNTQRLFGSAGYIMNNPSLGRAHWAPLAEANLAHVLSLVALGTFQIDPQSRAGILDPFKWYRAFDIPPVRSESRSVLVTTPRQTVLNRSHPMDSTRDVVLVKGSDISNHLVLINARLGSHALGDFARNASLFNLDDDVFDRRRTFSAVGRYLLFYVMNPTKPFRIVIDISASINADGKNTVPQAVVVGDRRYKLSALGRGSARMISPPLNPQHLLGHSFVAIDMGSDGVHFPNPKTGLMRLYGVDQGRDPRQFVGFARNISAISNEEYLRLKPPAAITRFPADLNDENLQYSGIYEDGWLSENAFALLSAPRGSQLEIAGSIPQIGAGVARTQVRVLVDDREVARRTLGAGAFNINAGASSLGMHRVSVHFSHAQRLINGDTRVVAALLSSIGYRIANVQTARQNSQTSGASSEPSDIAISPAVNLDRGWGVPERYRGQVFRWCGSEDAELRVEPAVRTLRLKLEPGPGVSGLPLRLTVRDAGARTVSRFQVSGYGVITVHLAKAHSAVMYLHAENGGAHVPTDPRILNYRVFSIASAN